MSPYERAMRRGQRTESGCLEFMGARHYAGYGDLGGIHAHRAAWEHEHGSIPPGMFVCHHCDNPPCFEITHLFLGTHQDNMADMKAKGRARGAEGLTNFNGRLTHEQVDEICSRYQRVGSRTNQRALAAEFGVTPQYVSQLARGLWRKTA